MHRMRASMCDSGTTMNLLAGTALETPHPAHPVPDYNIEIVEPDPEDCRENALSPEGHVKLRNYRLIGPGSGSLRAYTPSGDVHTTPTKGKLVPRFDDFDGVSPPRRRILELLRPDDPGHDVLEAIVRPAQRRPLLHHDDLEPVVTDDNWNFLQRNLLSPSPSGFSCPSPEPTRSRSPRAHYSSDYEDVDDVDDSAPTLADELHAAEFGGGTAVLPRRRQGSRREALREFRARSSAERDRLARMALAVEEDEAPAERGLAAAARQLDLMLAESRDLHDELAEIHEDMQAETRRAVWCASAARALGAETRTLQFLDDLLALLRGDVAAALRARGWPFALGPHRDPHANYIV